MLRIGWFIIAMILSVSAEPFVLITHPQNPIDTLTRSQVRMIYLKKRRFWNDTKLVALNLPPNNTLRNTFENKILKMNATQLDNYWVRAHYKGQCPPYRVESLKSMLLFVKKVKGAIGYIPKSEVGSGVKVIYEEHL
jgi:ABC-type phosphate transport system substrate-binding protein